MYTQNVVISMEEQEDQRRQASEGKPVKERPVWLTQSTVQGAYSEPDAAKNREPRFLSFCWSLVRFLNCGVKVGFIVNSKNTRETRHCVCL
jgi:hypothetical protein